MEIQHDMKPEQYLYRKKRTPTTFKINFEPGKNNKCPVPGCGGGSKTKY